jgi:peptide/nickel transport system permease protein
MQGLEEIAEPRLRGRRTRGWALPSLHLPRLRTPALPSPLPALRTAAEALPDVGRHLWRRLPVYAVALWVAVTVAYALPRLASRGGLSTPPAPGSLAGGYAHFVRELGTAHFALGVPGVASAVSSTLPYSLALVGVATVIAFVVGGVIGLVAAWNRGGIFDSVATTATALLWSIPAFAVAGIAIEFPVLRWHLFPLQWAYDLDRQPSWSWRFAESVARHAQLPLIVLVLSTVGLWALNLRALAVGVVNEDYVQLARAKGLSTPRILFHYVGRNSMLPALTGFAVAFSLALGGVAALEEVFSYPGGGWEMQQAATTGNVPLVQSLFIAFAVAVVLVNLLADAAQVLLDPRLRASGR